MARQRRIAGEDAASRVPFAIVNRVESQICIDCEKKSPETDTNYTLISAQHGWRLHRTRSRDGAFVMEWRCPDCWHKFKQATGAMSSPDLSNPKDEHRATPRSFFERASRRLRGSNSEPPDRE